MRTENVQRGELKRKKNGRREEKEKKTKFMHSLIYNIIGVRAIYQMIYDLICFLCVSNTIFIQSHYRVDHLIRYKIQHFRGETTRTVHRLNIHVQKVMH